MSLMQTEAVDFHGQELVTVNMDGVIYVAMKPVVEGMGMDWANQFVKIKHRQERFNCCDIAMVAQDGKPRTMISIPLKKLNGWLFGINPAKIPDAEVRSRVELYQEECFEALYNYWHHGFAARAGAGAAEPDSLTDSPEQSRANRIVDAERIFRSFGRAADAALRMSPGARIAANVAALRVTGIDVLAILAEAGFVPPEEARLSQERAQEDMADEIHQKILDWMAIHNRPYVQTREVWVEALGQNEADFIQAHKNKIGKIMGELGYVRRIIRIDGVHQVTTWWRREACQFH